MPGGVDSYAAGHAAVFLLVHLSRAARTIQGARGERQGGRLLCFFNSAQANESGNQPHWSQLRSRLQPRRGALCRHVKETGTDRAATFRALGSNQNKSCCATEFNTEFGLKLKPPPSTTTQQQTRCFCLHRIHTLHQMVQSRAVQTFCKE